MQPNDNEKTRKKLERLAWYLDSFIKIPGFNARIGLDGLIGLIPGIGDAIGALISSTIVVESARMGVPKVLLLKMAFNVAIDAIIGTVPILGDIFDFAWKANRRNMRLLNAYLDHPEETVVASRRFIWGLVAVLAGFVISIFLLGFLLVRALVNLITGG